MSQEKEIVLRSKGKVDDLISFIDKEILLNTIILTKIEDGMYKSLLIIKTNQLQEIKTNLQEELSEYIKNLKKEI